jgi:Domain of unknown function (DUF4157)/L,D-transpeptidase catalytic domain
MRERLQERERPEAVRVTATPGSLVSRKCACGGSTGAGRECDDCRTKRLMGKRAVAAESSASAEGKSESDSGSELVPAPVLRRDEGNGSTRLGLSRPGDACEIEADAVAEKVVSNLGSATPVQISAVGPFSAIHRQGDDDPGAVQDGSGNDDSVAGNDNLGVDGESGGGDTADYDLTCDDSGCPKMESSAARPARALSVNIPRPGGRPLESALRTLMESRFGHDFSRVSVHTDAEAARSARRLKAQAYTVGSDIYFGGGRYAPESTDGLRLLAHELTHVVQQSRQSWMPGMIRRKKHKTECSGDCASAKAPKHDGCISGSGPVNPAKFISSILVERAAHQATATWSDSSTTSYACSPSTKSGKGGKMPTPLGNFTIGVKCDSCHTNRKGDGMAWFTGIVERQIGFHDSQLVGPTHESHGCIRVSCSNAKEIHDNTDSGSTTVQVKA